MYSEKLKVRITTAPIFPMMIIYVKLILIDGRSLEISRENLTDYNVE